MNQSDFSRLLIRYAFGFGSALVLSVAAYLIATGGMGGSMPLTMVMLLGLAIIQLVIQLVCFLHLGVRGRSAGRTVTLMFTVMMMLVIVIGSLWIMKNLDYRMRMSSEAMNEYMIKQNKKGF